LNSPPLYVRICAGGTGGRVLYCVECGCCSGELGKGWSAFICEDPDGDDPPSITVYCPPCAASEFGYRPDLAENYVCGWEPILSDTTDELA
jgi:hypothetical protein